MTEPIADRHREIAGRRLSVAVAMVGAVLLAGVGLCAVGAPAPQALQAGATGDPADRYPGLNLIPWPRVMRPGEGHMALTAESRIVAEQAELKPLAEVLAGEIERLTGLKLTVATGAGQAGDIVLTARKSLQAGEPILAVRDGQVVRTRDGAHTIAVGDRAAVEGFDYRAVAEGTATLLQALRQSGGKVTLPELTVHDWPHADYCAMMVDVARQHHGVEWLRKMVQVCRFYKVRYLHLHLTDDQGWTFPSTKYPQLGSKNYGAHGRVAPKVYTLDELRDVVAYADARGVTLVPEIEMPGHSGAALRSLPEVFDAVNPKTKQPVGMGCMNMANEEIYPALDTIVGEVCAVFKSSPYFHMGGDEVSMGRVALHSGYQAFMAKHGLKGDAELGAHFVRRVNEIVKKHGKKTLKWEGLANEAAKDIVVMTWDKNNNTAAGLIAKGYTTITCPWDLGVPWEEWNLYVCNGSRLKKGDAVLGATLVAWEQPPATHLAGVRNVASRQERTWGPDNVVTTEGFAARFQALDAAVGRLLAMPVRPRLAATFTASADTRDLLAPVFAFDGNDATFYQSDRPPAVGDHLTVTLEKPTLVHAIEVHTGINHRGLLDGGAVQVSADGTAFTTVATLKQGSARATLTEHRVRAVRLLATAEQAEPLVVREIVLRLLVEVAGAVKDPATAVGAGNVAALKGDTTFELPAAECDVPAINRGFTLTLAGRGTYSGPISGTGDVEIDPGAKPGAAAVVLGGKAANTIHGNWRVKAGRLVLAKERGVHAVGGTIEVAGDAGIIWHSDNQVQDGASIRLLNSAKGGATLDLNGHSETMDRLTLDDRARILTDGPAGGGVLTVRELVVAGERLGDGVYSSASPWVRGSGYVLVGAARRMSVAGNIDDLHQAVGAGNIAVLTAAANVKLASGSCVVACDIQAFPLTLTSDGAAVRYGGFVTGNGPLRIEAAAPGQAKRQPLELTGPSANSYRGPTVLVRGMLKLSKSGGALTIPGNLDLGGSNPDNAGDGVIWGADGQLAAAAVVTLGGSQPCFLDLAGHKTAAARVVMSRAGTIRTGAGGALTVKQLHIDGKRLPDGAYRAPQPWLHGTGTVTVDARVDLQGRCGDCNARIGVGNVANLTGDAAFCYPVSDCDIDVLTNGHTLTLDSGDGNAYCYRGAIQGTGDVVLLMGPSHTDYKDAPLRLAGARANTTTGKFFVRKGRVQMEKPDGVDAISGDVVVGGQGFNDCLFWVHDNQVKDSAHITLIGAGNNGAAYLHLNGCSESVAGVTMTAANTIKTDGGNGARGMLTVRSLTIDGVALPAGTYTSATARWIEGQGTVVVQP